MDFLKIGRVASWIIPALTFAVCLGWSISHWGTAGLLVAALPAVAVARLSAMAASFLWGLIGLVVLIGWHVRAADTGAAFGAD